jgi:predicted nuclease with TOPRIM domain
MAAELENENARLKEELSDLKKTLEEVKEERTALRNEIRVSNFVRNHSRMLTSQVVQGPIFSMEILL